MSMNTVARNIAPTDAARLALMLGELRLPTIARAWPDLADTADREGSPCVRGVAARIGLANPRAQDTGIGSIWTTLQGSRGGAPAAAGEFGA